VAEAAVADLDLVRDGEPAVPPDLGVDRELTRKTVSSGAGSRPASRSENSTTEA
jgi:hypothetical protein